MNFPPQYINKHKHQCKFSTTCSKPVGVHYNLFKIYTMYKINILTLECHKLNKLNKRKNFQKFDKSQIKKDRIIPRPLLQLLLDVSGPQLSPKVVQRMNTIDSKTGLWVASAHVERQRQRKVFPKKDVRTHCPLQFAVWVLQTSQGAHLDLWSTADGNLFRNITTEPQSNERSWFGLMNQVFLYITWRAGVTACHLPGEDIKIYLKKVRGWIWFDAMLIMFCMNQGNIVTFTYQIKSFCVLILSFIFRNQNVQLKLLI